MKTDHNWVIDDLQWSILSGLLDYPEESRKCSVFWFSDKQLRFDLFTHIAKIKSGHVDLVWLAESCKNVSPYQIASLYDSPHPYREKLIRMIGQLGEEANKLIKIKRV